jgi:hypothetical protein
MGNPVGSVVAEGNNKGTVVGRTAYDFGAELVQVLGRLTPLFVLAAMFLYSIVEISGSYQKAQTSAMELHASSVEKLNSLLTSNFGALDAVRKSQLENLEKITALSGSITEAVAKAQVAEKKRQDATFELEKAQREQQQLQSVNKELQRQTWIAESTIDVAERLVAFLDNDRDLERDIRYLSRRYESVKLGGMTRDRDGNTYFGLYRVPGSDITRFIEFLQRSFPQFALRLVDAGGQEAAATGADKFKNEWQSMSRNVEFAAAQDQFVEQVYYARFLAQTKRFFTKSDGSLSFEPATRSIALQAVLWSVAVQHGANTPVVRKAFDGLDLNKADDATFIKAIYAERRKIAVYFPAESELSQKLLAVRYRFEEQEAVKMLEEQGQTK